MSDCLGCGTPIPQRGALVRVYCSNRCQRALERRQHVARWLATGEAFIGTGPGHYVRAHIADAQHHRCAICGHENRWQGTELRLVLDHIDGDSSNNRRENLRLVCPNCDSQLPTYKNRNKGKGRFSRRERYAAGKSF